MLRNIFKFNRRKFYRVKTDGIRIEINRINYHLTDLSHAGFAVFGNLRSNCPGEVFETDFVFKRGPRTMMVTCRSKQIWHQDGKTGFEFHQPTPRELASIDYFVKCHQVLDTDKTEKKKTA